MKQFFFFALFVTISNAQNHFENIEDDFEDFAELTREQIYTQTNKTTYIPGESIWFKTYIFSRDVMSFSDEASNIYCVLYDFKNQPVAQKMLMAINGVSNGEFLIDSTFQTGEYILKTYTNWSRNFKNEYVHHESKLKIINPDEYSVDNNISSQGEIDVQLLPEGGHLLAETNNRVGVVAKDSYGKAIKNLRVTLFENEKELIETELNHLGLNVFNLEPKLGVNYKARCYYDNKEYNIEIPQIEKKGAVIMTTESSDEVQVTVQTNNQTLPSLINKPFKLTIHNTVDLVSFDFIFQESTSQVFKFQKKKLFPGINIMTLFNSQGKAISERIYFNYHGIKLKSIEGYNISKQKDSIEVAVKMSDIAEDMFQSLSASVLPSETKSYNSNNNIASAFLLKPYLKGLVESPDYFFKDITEIKKKELNLLLLTQGWSRYNWDNIFNNQPEIIHDYDYGVNYRISSNSGRDETYLIYPNYNSKSELLTLKANSFQDKLGLFPVEGEFLRIGQVQNNKKLGKSNAVVSFTPKNIPEFNSAVSSVSVSQTNQLANLGANIKTSFLDKTTMLDEVKVTAKKEYTRIEKLQNKTIGKVYEFDEKMKRFYKTFAQFISSYGYVVELGNEVVFNPITGMEEMTLFRIETRNPVSINATKVPRIFLDNVYLSDYDFLSSFTMETVDYVIINKGGIGEGLRGGAGVIKIFTDPNKRKSTEPKIAFTEYKIPLAFSQPKQFYAPKYQSTNNTFFKEYGTIDWKPNLKFENGIIKFKVINIGVPINIYLEGVVNSDTLIAESLMID